jgi:signal transduction histidine kinase
MDSATAMDEQIAALTAHLAARRDSILRAWRKAVDRDSSLTTGASLPRTQLNDHIPDLLDVFERKLRNLAGSELTEARNRQKENAAAHGLQRWQQGYDLREVTREWGRLQLCVMDELESYASVHSDLSAHVMSTARRAWAELCSEGVSESTAKYFDLQQIEALGHVRDLEQALEQVKELERQRGELWREAAHDLRGNLGVVANATAGLSLQGVPDPLRDNFLRLLKKNVSSLHTLLDDVMNLARLQAGHEHRVVQPFDAGAVLTELCEIMQPAADERGLYLRTEGPRQLPVEGDTVKVQRIAQNLLTNAMKYTDRGGVTVRWGDSRENDANRWMLCVEDTGPGFHAGPGAPMAGALEAATDEARDVEHSAGSGKESRGASESSAPAVDVGDSRAVHQAPGEGIGLSIVKRLCELLDAAVEMESNPGEGTTLRIIFPRHYDRVEHKQYRPY